MRRKSLLTTRTKQNSIEIGEQIFPSPSSAEQASIVEVFPEYDNTIQFFALGKIGSQGKQYENGICAISMHYVGFFSQKSSGKVKKIAFFNILSLKKFILSHANKHQQLILETEAINASLLSGPVLMAARIIYRNYSFSTFPIPLEKKTVFNSYDISLFPPIQFPLSISQIFQFRFAALSSQNELKYDHSVTEYLHSLIQSHNPIFNFNHLPKTFLPQQLFPLFQSLIHIPQIIGISCCNYNAPTVFSSIIPLIEKSKYIRVIKLINCNAIDGLIDFSRALEFNKDLPLEQLLINENDFDDLSPLIQTISKLKAKLTHFSISGCRITSAIFKQFCKLLLSSNSLSSLVHIGIGGAELTEDAIVDFREYLKLNRDLISLDLSGSSHFSSLLAALSNAFSSFSSSVRSLNLSGCDFDDSSFSQLSNIVPFITELDISNTNLNYYEISDVISLLGKSCPSSSYLTIKLNRMNIEKEKSLLVIRGFLSNDLKKWKRIELDDTHISADELCAYQALFLHMPNLEYLSMGGNFGEKEAQLASSLTEISSLKSLRLSNSKLASIIPQVIATTTLKEVDFSYGNLTDNDAILLLSSENLEKVKLEGIEFNDVNAIIEKVNHKCNLKHIPFKGAILPLKPKGYPINSSESKKQNSTFSEFSISELFDLNSNSNFYQHSCVCEDLQMPYPFGDQPCEKQGVQIGDPNVYSTFHLNMIAFEKNATVTKIKKVLEYPKVQQDASESESEYSSDLSIDELVHSNLISSLSDTIFTGIGGTLSDSSLDSSDHRKKKKNRLSKLSASSLQNDSDEKSSSLDKFNEIKAKENTKASKENEKINGITIFDTNKIDKRESSSDDEIDAALVFAVSKSQDSFLHVSYADAVKSDHDEEEEVKRKGRKLKSALVDNNNSNLTKEQKHRKRKRSSPLNSPRHRKSSAAGFEEEEAESEAESSYSNSDNKKVNDDDSDGNNDSSSGRTHHHSRHRRKHKEQQPSSPQQDQQRKIKKSKSYNTSASPKNQVKNYDEEIKLEEEDNDINLDVNFNLNLDEEINILNLENDDENENKIKSSHHQSKTKRKRSIQKEQEQEQNQEEEEIETLRRRKQKRKHRQQYDEDDDDMLDENKRNEIEINAEKVKKNVHHRQNRLELEVDVDSDINNDNDSDVPLVFTSPTTAKKLFGSIAEESSAAMQQQQPLRKVPPPPPSLSTSMSGVSSPSSFISGSPSAPAAFQQSPKKKGSGNQQNPIILAFSPPTEP